MEIPALVVTLVGALATTFGAVWLLFGFDPDDPRYTVDGPLYPGVQQTKVVSNLLHDQREVSVLLAVGAMIQLVGAAMTVAAVIEAGR